MSRYWFSILSFLKYFIRYLRIFHRIKRYIIKIKLIQIYACKISNIILDYLFEYIRRYVVICRTIFDKLSRNIAKETEFFSNILKVFVIYWLQIDVIIKTLQHRGLQVIKKKIKRWKVEIGLGSKVLWSICFYIPIRRITSVPHCIM